MSWKLHSVLGSTESKVSFDIYVNEKSEAMLRVESVVAVIELYYNSVEKLKNHFENKASEAYLSLDEYLNKWFMQALRDSL